MIGIDEAGYGPNLGPLVMTSVAFRVPPAVAGRNLWKTLKRVVRRADDDEDDRLLVEDSKVVYSPARGLLELERGVLAILSVLTGEGLLSKHLLDHLCPAHLPDLSLESWFTGQTPIPHVAELEIVSELSARFRTCCGNKDVVLGLVRSVVICPPKFNSLLEKWGSKGAILGQGLAELIDGNLTVADDREPIAFQIDKHGGRNDYYAMLQSALPDNMVVCERESMNASSYAVFGRGREVRFTFQPRADSE
jgi:hypothetical protein